MDCGGNPESFRGTPLSYRRTGPHEPKRRRRSALPAHSTVVYLQKATLTGCWIRPFFDEPCEKRPGRWASRLVRRC